MAEHIAKFNLITGRFGCLYDDAIAENLEVLTDRPTETRRAGDVWANSRGLWWVQIQGWVPGGMRVLGPFKLYREAVAAEIAYLQTVL